MFANKIELSKLLGCSLPTLDRLLYRHGDAFPIESKGKNGVEWQFDVDRVLAFLTEQEAAAAAAGNGRDELMRQYLLPGTESSALAGYSAANLLRLAQLRRLESQERKEAAFLLVASDVRSNLTSALAKFNHSMATAIRQIMHDHNIPEAVIRSAESRIAEAQSTVRKSLGNLLEQSTGPTETAASLL